MKARECGAIETIVSAMKAQIQNPDLCENGIRALLSITFNGKDY